MRVIMFQDRFAELVRGGDKCQTIRWSARCRPGDVLSLRRWTGKPYRSKQETLREAVCTAVSPVAMHGLPFHGWLIEWRPGKVRRDVGRVPCTH
jgi:hypothetical protein